MERSRRTVEDGMDGGGDGGGTSSISLIAPNETEDALRVSTSQDPESRDKPMQRLGSGYYSSDDMSGAKMTDRVTRRKASLHK